MSNHARVAPRLPILFLSLASLPCFQIAFAPPVFAQRRNKLYYLAHCPGYARVPARLRAQFKGIEEAERAGHKAAPDRLQ